MNPKDNEAGKRTVGPFSKTPLILYPTGSPDFSPGPRAPAPVTQPISSQVFSLPLSAASITSFRDSLSTWSPPPYVSLQPMSHSSSMLLSGSSSVPVEENRDFCIGFNKNPSFPPPRPNSMRVSGKTVPPRGRHRRTHSVIFGPKDTELILNGDSSHGKKPIEELSDEIMKLNAEDNGNDMIQTNLGVKRRAENNIDPFPKSNKRS